MSLNLTRRLVSQEDSSVIARPDVPRSRFVGSWTRKTTFDAGYLVPFMVDEVLPGDHLKYDVTAYIRLSTPLFPLMDNMRVDTFFFFVPNRLVWSNWKKFMGEQTNPGDSISYTIPKLALNSAFGTGGVGLIWDYFGIPVGMRSGTESISVNVLPFRAYNLIYNEWFRDQNLVNAATVTVADSGDATADFTLRKRAKAHDYFTTCLPWPQKFTAPSIQSAVKGLGVPTAQLSSGLAPFGGYETTAAGITPTAQSWANAQSTAAAPYWVETDASGYPQVFAEADVNAFRYAFMVQTLLERDARGGTRYTEIVKNHFGVESPDARLQRPEFIGGGSAPMNITPIAQTAEGASTTVGALGAAGTSVGSHKASVAATEHGYIIGLINVRSELSYSQGLHKMWTRSTRYDFYWPSLAGLGEQAVLRQEIYCTGVDADDQTVFGYQERWHEYRTRTSEVTGLFRPKAATPIDEWHLSQEFTSAPTLGQTFIEETPPMSRVLALSPATNQELLGDILIKREAVRPIPMYGTPVSLGRF